MFWPIRAGRTLLGRAGAADNIDIEINEQTTSSNHAVLHADGASRTVVVEDMHSTNGTYVNDEHIGGGGRRDLRDGDRLRLGAYNLIVKVIARV